MSWCNAPAEYGAIHFHDDDLYDAGWDTDFDFSVPESLKSGIYAAHVRTDEDEDYIHFVILPANGKRIAKGAFLVPTASYMAYGNEHLATDSPGAEASIGRLPVLYPSNVFLNEHRE